MRDDKFANAILEDPGKQTLALFRPLVEGLTFLVLIGMVVSSTPNASDVPHPSRVPLSSPLNFEPNVGQAPATVRYLAHAGDFTVALTDMGLALATTQKLEGRKLKRGSRNNSTNIVELHLIGANVSSIPVAEERQPSVSNYFLGSDARLWRRRVPNFAQIRYPRVYPGIDWIFHGNGRALELDWIVSPHADASQIKFRIDGVDRISIDSGGNLELGLANRSFSGLVPVAYQRDASGHRTLIGASYRIRDGEVSLALASYDRNRTLIIDPAVVYSTYLGGSADEFANGIAVDAQGDAYVVGETSSTDFPTVNGLAGPASGANAFVSKFTSSGGALLWSTFLGGSGDDQARAVALDAEGNAYIVGSTTSSDFPAVNAFQASIKSSGSGASSAFVSKVNASGEALEYSTYLGGSGTEDAFGVAVDDQGSAYVVGTTGSSDFPTVNALQTQFNGQRDAFVTKFSDTGDALVYSTFLGGSGADTAYAVELDDAGEAFVAGSTTSSDFPTTAPLQASNNTGGGRTAFVSKITASGTALVYSTYLGGTGADDALAVATDSLGDAFVAGETLSIDFPVVNGFQSTNKAVTGHGGTNAFISKINPTGSGLAYSSYLGGSGGGNGLLGDIAYGVAVDSSGDAYVTGGTSSVDFPTVDPIQASNEGVAAGATNAFISEFNPSGSALLFSTYLGGTGSTGGQVNTGVALGDVAKSVAIDSKDDIFVAGQTASSNFPIVNAFQATNRTTSGSSTAFVTMIGQEATSSSGDGGSGSNSPKHGGGGIDLSEIAVLTACVIGRTVRRRRLQRQRIGEGY